MDLGSRREDFTQIVNLTPEACYDAFLQHVWRGGGGLGSTPSILTEGDAVTGAGCRRQVPGGIQEEILEGVRGKYLEYHIPAGPWPVRALDIAT